MSLESIHSAVSQEKSNETKNIDTTDRDRILKEISERTKNTLISKESKEQQIQADKQNIMESLQSIYDAGGNIRDIEQLIPEGDLDMSNVNDIISAKFSLHGVTFLIPKRSTNVLENYIPELTKQYDIDEDALRLKMQRNQGRVSLAELEIVDLPIATTMPEGNTTSIKSIISKGALNITFKAR